MIEIKFCLYEVQFVTCLSVLLVCPLRYHSFSSRHGLCTVLQHHFQHYFSCPITRRHNFRLVQIETNCRRHFKVHLKRKISAMSGIKHCERRRNCLLQAILLFLQCFPQLYVFSVSKCGIVCDRLYCGGPCIN